MILSTGTGTGIYSLKGTFVNGLPTIAWAGYCGSAYYTENQRIRRIGQRSASIHLRNVCSIFRILYIRLKIYALHDRIYLVLLKANLKGISLTFCW